jgi:hypothetical protein
MSGTFVGFGFAISSERRQSVPSETRPDHQFEARAVRLAGKIDWDWIDGEFRARAPRPRARRPTHFATLPACAKLDDRKTPITAADLLNDQVVPLFEEHDVKLLLAPSREERGCSIVPNRQTIGYAATPKNIETISSLLQRVINANVRNVIFSSGRRVLARGRAQAPA